VLSTEEYPELPKIETGDKVTILQNLLKNMLKQTLYAVSNDETKGVLSGELIDIENNILQIIGIDGIRLAVRKENIEDSESKKIIIPGKTLREITSLLRDDDEETCNIIVDERHAIFEIGEYKVYTRLLEGNFPNFHSSVATEFKTKVLVDTDELITAYEKCSVVINDKNKAPAICKFENGKVYISCKTALGNIKDEVDIEFEGENLEIAINSKFIIEALKNSDSDKVWIKMNESNKPVVIVPPVGDSYLFLIMPVNIR
jgi:DNA polymerase-3 subunit beta